MKMPTHTTRIALAAGCALASASCAALWGFDDATVTDAGAGSDAGGQADGGTTSGSGSGTGTDAGAGATPDAVVGAPDVHAIAVPDAGPSACEPACTGGTTCVDAVGAPGVCVDESAPCTDSSGCPAGGCCAWLDPDAGTGRCLAPGPARSSVSCLCTRKGTGQARATCAVCAAPPAATSAKVTVCMAM
jgi:hypothetical protein